MINAVIEYIVDLDQDIPSISQKKCRDIEEQSKYAIKQIRLEIKLTIILVLFIMKLTWFCLNLFLFWMPRGLVYQKYRRFVNKIPIISSVLMMYETIIFMIYFESN
tara:strand:- start:2626 stop:2943 length:318 start_codon:yes stop_codon:yes gene_type:complete